MQACGLVQPAERAPRHLPGTYRPCHVAVQSLGTIQLLSGSGQQLAHQAKNPAGGCRLHKAAALLPEADVYHLSPSCCYHPSAALLWLVQTIAAAHALSGCGQCQMPVLGMHEPHQIVSITCRL